MAIELCYRTDRHDRTQTVVRILSFFEKWSRTLVNHNYAVVDRGSNDKCTRVKNSRICCTKVPLADRFKFVISPDFPVGIVTNPDGNGRPSLLTISSTERVNAYYRSVKDSWEHGEELKLATFQQRRDGFLPLMRFFIGKICIKRTLAIPMHDFKCAMIFNRIDSEEVLTPTTFPPDTNNSITSNVSIKLVIISHYNFSVPRFSIEFDGKEARTLSP